MKDELKKNYDEESLNIVYNFAKKMTKEFGDLIKVIAIFGSATKKEDLDPNSDIDVLVVVDDVDFKIDDALAQTYRVLTGKIVEKVSKKLHVTTLKLTHFWEYVKVGDPVVLNILRDGFAVLDSGFFTPLQVLLYQGRIRPSEEAIYTYFERAPRSLKQVEYNLLKSISDLYWAMIDSAHAALMRIGEMPANPREIPKIVEEKLVNTKLVSKDCADFAKEIYELSKKIAHNEIKEVSGAEIDELKERARKFVDEMKKIVLK
ncbi:MAG: hypothetical protein PWP03_382 [Candidatus Woesearchaeota archaeon]|nr:hypothetical protein [Candidatus Woesearchaeota archaeon]MDN5327744.1 hypothetical protein [Candidatus Woesearchaeota archaeon]